MGKSASGGRAAEEFQFQFLASIAQVQVRDGFTMRYFRRGSHGLAGSRYLVFSLIGELAGGLVSAKWEERLIVSRTAILKESP